MRWLGNDGLRLAAALTAALVAGSLVAGSLAPAVAAAAPRPRPTDTPAGQSAGGSVPNALQVFNDYATPARSHSSARVVVHYVVLGIDAPPLNDDDADGVPDYVERVGEAADTAIAYFERRGFAPIPRDSGGPDSRPDVYISRFAPGYFGVALPAVDAVGGAFLAVSNGLDPSPDRSFGSLYATVAHEVFHLVQFSYFDAAADPELPGWALEGSAAAMESGVYPEVADLASTLQLRGWLAAPQHSLTTESYGAQLLWRYLDEREPRLLPAYLARVARGPGTGAAAALATVYERVAREPFAPAFERFATWFGEQYSDRLTPYAALGARDRRRGCVPPLAVHYVRLSRAAATVRLRFGGRPAAGVVAYELESEYAGQPSASRRVAASVADGGRSRTFTVPASLRRSARYLRPTLVVANGNAAGTLCYRVETGS